MILTSPLLLNQLIGKYKLDSFYKVSFSRSCAVKNLPTDFLIEISFVISLLVLVITTLLCWCGLLILHLVLLVKPCCIVEFRRLSFVLHEFRNWYGGSGFLSSFSWVTSYPEKSQYFSFTVLYAYTISMSLYRYLCFFGGTVSEILCKMFAFMTYS